MIEEKLIRIIEVVPYNLEWKEEFLREADIIRNLMGDEILYIHHIGSTSIPGIYAKPVIDILLEVKDIENIDSYNEKMNEIGYIARGEYGIKGRRYFLKGLFNRTHHVHAYLTGNPEITRHLNFRDYLIAHPAIAGQYGELKKVLSLKFKYDATAYCDGKDEFIKGIDKKAEKWTQAK